MSDLLLAVASLVAGAAISYWITVRHKPTRSMHHFAKDFDLVNKSELGLRNELRLNLLGNDVDAVRLCRIIIWNSGSECVKRSDLASSDKLRIKATAAENLSVISEFQNRGAIGLKTRITGNEIEISFDLLDSGDWVEIRFIHDRNRIGSDSKLREPKLIGSVAGIPSGVQRLDLEDYLNETHWTGVYKAYSLLALNISVFVVTVISFKMSKIGTNIGNSDKSLVGAFPYVMLFLALFVGLCTIAYFYSRRTVTRTIVPGSISKAIRK